MTREGTSRGRDRVTAKRVTERTTEDARDLATAPRTTTYWEAQANYRSTFDMRERFEELTTRELLARSYATLKARGNYEPRKHGDASKHQPLTATEHLEILALGEAMARYYRHPARIDEAVKAGASWAQIADAVGSDEAQARRAYREWADGQHRLHADYEGKFGMNEAEHAAAISRACESPADPRPGTRPSARLANASAPRLRPKGRPGGDRPGATCTSATRAAHRAAFRPGHYAPRNDGAAQ